MEERENLIVLRGKFKSCKGTAIDIGPDEEPKINLSVNVGGGPYTNTLQEDHSYAMAFVTGYIFTLKQKIDMINAQLKSL